MGDPKYSRRIWKKPKRPLNYELKMEELKLVGTFGLKTKKELWKARTELSRVRKQARSLLGLRKEEREEKEPIFMKSLVKINLVNNDSTLDNVLNLQVVDLLERRLQTIVQKKLEFNSPYQARQAITHGHVMIDDRIINIPSYIVKKDEEGKIRYTAGSKLQQNISKMKTRKDTDKIGSQVEKDIAQVEPLEELAKEKKEEENDDKEKVSESTDPKPQDAKTDTTDKPNSDKE